MTLIKSRNYFLEKIRNCLFGICCVVLFSIAGLSFDKPVKAISTTLTSGIVSLDKYYVNGVAEVKTLTAAPGDYVTVRLRYNNTASVSALNTVLNDSLPSAKFNYIPSTLKNCLINSTNCVALSDSLWSGVNLTTATSAGFYSYPNTAATGNLELGRLKYIHMVTCSQQNGQNESFIQSIDNTSIFAPSCLSVSGSSTVQNYNSVSILGQRYLHQTVCMFGSGEKEVFTQSVDNSPSFTPNCSSFAGSTLDSSSTIDLLAQRYLHQTVCMFGSGEKEIFTQSVDNSPSFAPNCSSLAGSTLDSSSTIDMFSPSNGSGYIEYQMKSIIVENFNSNLNTEIGDYGTNATLSSSNFSTLTETMTNSLSLKVYCDNIQPTGGQRDLSLSDAELRAGQDFRCNYQTSICPIVFEDINTNGLYDVGVDTLTSDVQVLLQSSDGSTTYATMTTNNLAQCFPNLLHGREYKINIPTPPTGTSTTGGNSKLESISYKTTQSNAIFGYANGSLILNVPASVVLPAITVDSKPNDVSTAISPIQVIDTRLANPGWTLTANVANFTSQAIPDSILNVANAFRNAPGSVIVNSGQTSGINIGNQKTINSTTDTISIFGGTAGNSKGNYQIDTNITLTVPSLTRATTYQSVYTYTII